MQTRKLGNSDMHITPVGYGAWAVGGSGWDFAWGAQDDDDSIGAIHRSLELGVNWIDTAAVYGIGHSEEIVALALREWKGRRPYVFTKCAMRWDKNGRVTKVHSAASIRQECEDSLRRLQVDVIDLYQIHWPPEDNGPGLEESWSTLAALRKASARRKNRSGHLAPAALLADSSPHRKRNSALLRTPWHRRDRLLPNGLRPAHRRNDPRARHKFSGRRLAQEQSGIP
jgi:aryl-alcohol dehydrogenase-like predicted oxidoreductase